MSNYIAPTTEMNFVLNAVANLDEVCAQPGFEDSSPDLIASVLSEAAKFAGEVIAPLNTVGDLIGTKIVKQQVRETTGFAEAYQKFIEGGWTALPCNPEYGGMGLPECVGIAAMEMWSAANLSFALCPMLGQGAIEAIATHASEELRNIYLEKMISGEWTGTMNLTEPQAGSDLAAIKTKAVRDLDHYRITGNKIFITWGDHQMTDNIVHLVLARLEGAPEGVKGISLFLVPKFMVNADGSIGPRNDVYAHSIEHKIGIHASPTCVMGYGYNNDGENNKDKNNDKGKTGAIGYLVGQENMGLSYMFTMMNHARINVGTQGLALSDRALQQAVSYAKERIQGSAPNSTTRDPIIRHPDVKRMLMVMRALTEASRTLCYVTAASFDIGHHSNDESRKLAALKRGELLTPLAKAWSTEVSQEVTSLGVQIHGGMGYIEETGAAQFMRDARITTIYEGTSGIQANDFIGRKVLRDKAAELSLVISEMRTTISDLEAGDNKLQDIAIGLKQATNELENIKDWLLDHRDDAHLTAAVAFNLMMGAGTCVAGWLMGKSALAAVASMRDDPAFYGAKITTCRFYTAHILPRAQSYFDTVKATAGADLMLDDEAF